MRRLRLLLVPLLCASGCRQKAVEPSPALLSEVKQRLADRDARLTSYRLVGSVHDRGQPEVPFRFEFRAPHRMRGTLALDGAERTFCFDGERLFELSTADRRLTTFELRLAPAQRAEVLNRTFAPFVPEGFRAPLLPLTGLAARKVAHPQGPEAVELTGSVSDETGQPVPVRTLLRWPSMDLLAKHTGPVELRVDEEHCDPSLGLCVPRRLTRLERGGPVSTTTLSSVELGVALPGDRFRLAAPKSFEVVTRQLVEADGQAPHRP